MTSIKIAGLVAYGNFTTVFGNQKMLRTNAVHACIPSLFFHFLKGDNRVSVLCGISSTTWLQLRHNVQPQTAWKNVFHNSAILISHSWLENVDRQMHKLVLSGTC